MFLFVSFCSRIHGDVAIIVLERTSQVQHSHYRRRGSVMDGSETGNQTFFLELKIVSAKKSKFNQLQWKHYSVSRLFYNFSDVPHLKVRMSNKSHLSSFYRTQSQKLSQGSNSIPIT